jgi:hypothetical protein
VFWQLLNRAKEIEERSLLSHFLSTKLNLKGLSRFCFLSRLIDGGKYFAQLGSACQRSRSASSSSLNLL